MLLPSGALYHLSLCVTHTSENIAKVTRSLTLTESLDEYIGRIEHPNEAYRHRQDLERAYSIAAYPSDNLHFPCTLDQSYYLSLSDSTERDKTQVVVKYRKRIEKELSRR